MNSRRNRIVTKILFIAAFVVGIPMLAAIGLRLAGLLNPYKIPTGSMHPTIRTNDCIVTEGVSYLLHSPARGELAVFRTDNLAGLPPGDMLIQRIVGLPGEKIGIRDGHIMIDGKSVDFTAPDGSTLRYANVGLLHDLKAEIVVPPNCYFMLGDNSTNSLDSRYWGFLPRKNIRGKFWFRYWPLH